MRVGQWYHIGNYSDICTSVVLVRPCNFSFSFSFVAQLNTFSFSYSKISELFLVLVLVESMNYF